MSKDCRRVISMLIDAWYTIHLYVHHYTLQWCHNGRDGISNHQLHDCLLSHLFRRRSQETPKLRVTGLCAGNSPVTGEFPTKRASNVENVSIWWRHHDNNHTTPMALKLIARVILVCYSCQCLRFISSVLGPLFFVTFVLTVYFVLVNMFLGILGIAFFEVNKYPVFVF